MQNFNKNGGGSKNVVASLFHREMQGTPHNRNAFHPSVFADLKLTSQVVGHSAEARFVMFDSSGKFFITGSDDNLVKIWNAKDGRLMFTLRGSCGVIAGIAVNNENSLVAAGSRDGCIWIWSLQSGAIVRSMMFHTGNLTSIAFSPAPLTVQEKGYIITTSLDGSVAFSSYYLDENKEIKFNEYTTVYDLEEPKPTEELYCAAISPGGLFLVTGGKGPTVCVYLMVPEGGGDPLRILQRPVHPSDVLCVSWAKNSLAFVTGGEESSVYLWRFINGEWIVKGLKCYTKKDHDLARVKKQKILRVAWSRNDAVVSAILSDNTVRIWLPFSEKNFVRKLSWHHYDTINVLQPHPIHEDLLTTAGEDGQIVLWNLNNRSLLANETEILFQYQPLNNDRAAIKDCKWAADGLSLIATDALGRVLIFTKHTKEQLNLPALPHDMFFHTDFVNLTPYLTTGLLVDSLMEMPPHLMSPPWLINRNGYLQPIEFQALVPGREHIPQANLTNDYEQSRENYNHTHRGGIFHRVIIPQLSNSDYMAAELARHERISIENGWYKISQDITQDMSASTSEQDQLSALEETAISDGLNNLVP